MNVSYLWLKSLLNFTLTPDQLGEALVRLGIGVENTTDIGDDTSYELELTANRPDWLGHLGIARDLAALLGLSLKIPEANLPPPGKKKVQDLASVTIEDTVNCPRYTGMILEGVKIAPSPAWLSDRLLAVGQKPINNVVDATNYVLMLTGQPLHAFDFDKLEERRIVVRQARPGETILLLENAKEGKRTPLKPGHLVIADGKKPSALAGIMGGTETGITEKTVTVFLESARFAKTSIRKTRRELGIQSDAGYRFERHIDPALVVYAAKLAAKIILDTAGGTLCEGLLDQGRPGDEPLPPVSLRFAKMQELLGFSVTPDRVRTIFKGLGLTIREETAEKITVIPPTYRPDLELEADLIEDVGRIEGFDKIKANPAMTILSGRPRPTEALLDRLRDGLITWGFSEALGDVFTSPKRAGLIDAFSTGAPYVVRNPLNREENVLRLSAVPGLLASLEFNLNNFIESIDLFEIGRIFLPSGVKLPDERLVLGLVSNTLDFASLKGVLENALKVVSGRIPEAQPSTHRFLQADQQANLSLNGKVIGTFGQVGQNLREAFSLKGNALVAELDLGAAMAEKTGEPLFKDFSRFPLVKRDLAVVLDEPISWDQVRSTVESLGLPNLKELQFFDAFRGPAIGEGKKSYAFSLRYGSSERTLTAEEVDADQKRIIEKLRESLGAALREK